MNDDKSVAINQFFIPIKEIFQLLCVRLTSMLVKKKTDRQKEKELLWKEDRI